MTVPVPESIRATAIEAALAAVMNKPSASQPSIAEYGPGDELDARQVVINAVDAVLPAVVAQVQAEAGRKALLDWADFQEAAMREFDYVMTREDREETAAWCKSVRHYAGQEYPAIRAVPANTNTDPESPDSEEADRG